MNEGLQTRWGCLRPKDDVVEEEDVNFVRVAALVRDAIRKLNALGCAMRDIKHTTRILIPRSKRIMCIYKIFKFLEMEIYLSFGHILHFETSKRVICHSQ